MNRLDDLLDTAAADLQRAVNDMAPDVRLHADRHDVDEFELAATHATRPTARRALLAGAVGVAAAAAVAIMVVASDTSDRRRPAGVSTTAVSAPSGAVFAPLELAATPPGYALAGQVERPAGGGDVKTAVFVRRDPIGAVIQKAVVRVGHLSRYGGAASPARAAPANLPNATDGGVLIDASIGIIRIEYALDAAGNLILETHQADARTTTNTTTTAATVAQMDQIVAALRIAPSNDISVDGTLPDRWELAVAGNEPENVTSTLVQAFEIDTPDGGAKIIISNIATDDPAFPYWAMTDTLTPLVVRGHDGHLSLDTTYGGPIPVPTLIWPEAPGHWVTLRADGMTTDRLVQLANELTTADHNWSPDGTPATTTTLGP